MSPPPPFLSSSLLSSPELKSSQRIKTRRARQTRKFSSCVCGSARRIPHPRSRSTRTGSARAIRNQESQGCKSGHLPPRGDLRGATGTGQALAAVAAAAVFAAQLRFIRDESELNLSQASFVASPCEECAVKASGHHGRTIMRRVLAPFQSDCSRHDTISPSSSEH